VKQNTPNLKLAGQRAQKAKVIYQHLHDDQTIRHIGKQKTCYVRSYGCQSNLLDGETMIGILKLIGYRVVDDINQADLVILNACAVRENAEKKVYGEIGLLKRQFKLRKNFMLGVCGCMFQQENTVKKIIEHYPYVSFVFGTHNLYDLPYIIQEVDETKKQVIKVYSKEGDVIEGLPIDRTNKFKAFVNIMYGCDRFCSYCIVPYTRGKIRSRKKNDILNEIKQLIKDGYQEVTLLGQNVNSYGNDQNDDYHFVDLLNDICQLPIKRIRYTTSNP
jgi:tRNA-2-methylthio-N6-dimethylallyladenosine synthase